MKESMFTVFKVKNGLETVRKKEHYIKIVDIQKTGNFVNENVVLELNNNKKAYK